MRPFRNGHRRGEIVQVDGKGRIRIRESNEEGKLGDTIDEDAARVHQEALVARAALPADMEVVNVAL